MNDDCCMTDASDELVECAMVISISSLRSFTGISVLSPRITNELTFDCIIPAEESHVNGLNSVKVTYEVEDIYCISCHMWQWKIKHLSAPLNKVYKSYYYFITVYVYFEIGVE